MDFTKLIPQTAYEILRWVIAVVMPAVASLLAGLNAAWGWNWPMEAILATFTTIETFLGIIFLGAKYSYDAEEKKSK